MLSLVSLLISCCWPLLVCNPIAAHSSAGLGVSQAMDGPCFPTSSYRIPKITVGGITLTSGVITVPGCNSLDTVGLLLFHNGFAVRCFCIQSILDSLLILSLLFLTSIHVQYTCTHVDQSGRGQARHESVNLSLDRHSLPPLSAQKRQACLILAKLC